MKRTLLFVLLGIVIGYAFSYLKPQQKPLQRAKETTGIENYFPVKEGSFWEYKGTKKEQQVDGKIETSEIDKRVEVNSVTTETEANTLSITNDGQAEKWLVSGNSIDFEPDEPQDKFILSFPLYIGQKWGDEIQLRNRDDGYYTWEVEQKLPQEVLGKKYNDCFRIAFKTLSGTSYKIFCYGIGVVEEGYKHNGTILEEVYKLTAI